MAAGAWRTGEPPSGSQRRDIPRRGRGGRAQPEPALAPRLAGGQLQRTVGNRAVSRMVAQRHRVAATPIHRHTATDLFGAPGTTLADFERSTRVQADWFAEPSLTATDRTDLHNLLRKVAEGPHILAGTGDLPLAEARTVSAADWVPLAAFGRACHGGAGTVRVLGAGAYPLARRIALGRSLLALEAVIPAEVLAVTVSEQQLVDVDSRAMVPKIKDYWDRFKPHLQRGYEPGAGARALEFQNVLDLLNGPGIAPFAPLLGRIRNLHRFTVPTLNRLARNFADVSRRHQVHLVLHTGHDAGAFQDSARLFEDLVVNSPNLVLMLEGRDSLAQMTTMVRDLTASHGKRDSKGTARLGQVMIAGHGQARHVGMAGTGAPVVTGGSVTYPGDALDLDTNKQRTEELLDALLTNLDPKTARVVFAGCLVGSNPVPAGTPAGDVAAHIAANPSLATFTENRGRALGLSAGFTQGARASVGLSAATSLRDAGGNLKIDYPFDPDAFGSASAYVATGHEPEGLFRAAVEVAATAGPVTAETQLRARLAAGISATHGWWDECTVALVNVALAGVAPGAGVSVERLNMIAHLAQAPFLARFSTSFNITVGFIAGHVNGQPIANDVYTRIVATPTIGTPPDLRAQIGRFLLEQAWLASGAARAAPLIALLDATAPLTAPIIRRHLDVARVGGSSGDLFPAGAAATSGRVRLALAWLGTDPANADVRAFLDAQVTTPPTGPELSATVRAELGGLTESEILEALGRLTPTTVVAGGGGTTVTLPSANVEVRKAGVNQVRVEPQPYQATVRPHVLNVRTLPGMTGTPFAWVHRGDLLDVVGFTHDWAAVDVRGRLGFVHRSQVTPP